MDVNLKNRIEIQILQTKANEQLRKKEINASSLKSSK